MRAGKGRCSYCKGVFTKGGVIKHLVTCPARSERLGSDQAESEEYFWLAVSGAHHPEYWMYLEVAAWATLYDLDDFLRDTWVECCGHLSLFYIEGIEYMSTLEYASDFDDDIPVKHMDVELQDILREGMQFIYEYDFGSTTTLKLKVLGLHTGTEAKNEIEIMARNLAPVIKCSHCDNAAEMVCCWDDDWLCGNCAREHPHGEGYLLPVVNSPRVGVCAYCGSDDKKAGRQTDTFG